MTKNLRLITITLAIASELLLIRASLPIAIQRYVNDQLSQSPNYESSIGDVDLYLLRGAYRIDDVAINKIEGGIPVPLFAALSVKINIY